MLLDFVSQLLNLLVSLQNGVGGDLELTGSLLELLLELVDLGLHLLSHLLRVALQICSLPLEKVLQLADLRIEVVLHLLELCLHFGLKIAQSLFVILNQGILLVFEKLVHLFPLVFVVLLHFCNLSFMILGHDSDFFLQLVHEVPGLSLQHLQLVFEILDLTLISNFRFLSPIDFLLFFRSDAIKVSLEIGNLFLQFLNSIIEFCYLFL